MKITTLSILCLILCIGINCLAEESLSISVKVIDDKLEVVVHNDSSENELRILRGKNYLPYLEFYLWISDVGFLLFDTEYLKTFSGIVPDEEIFLRPDEKYSARIPLEGLCPLQEVVVKFMKDVFISKNTETMIQVSLAHNSKTYYSEKIDLSYEVVKKIIRTSVDNFEKQ